MPGSMNLAAPLAPDIRPAAERDAGCTLGPVPTDEFRFLQALEDAISLRASRAGECGAHCERLPDGGCDDHERDLELIGEYQEASRQCSERIAAIRAHATTRGVSAP
jgi:hypothetical protein